VIFFFSQTITHLSNQETGKANKVSALFRQVGIKNTTHSINSVSRVVKLNVGLLGVVRRPQYGSVVSWRLENPTLWIVKKFFKTFFFSLFVSEKLVQGILKGEVSLYC
jgi:hypothetical protein